jgi:hypothetical protein
VTGGWAAAVDRGDLDECLRWVDDLAGGRQWDDLDALRLRCRRAHERGHQLWPAASYAAHRLALEGPAAAAAEVAQHDGAAFTLGPLWEVAASTHTWQELAPHMEAGPIADLAAQERVLRGEAVDRAGDDLPYELAGVEPAYLLATYHADEVVVDGPPPPEFGPPHRLTGRPAAPRPHEAVADAWRNVVAPWLTQSTGRLVTSCVAGDTEVAVATLVERRPVALAPIGPGDALLRLQWAGASGGAHGRRRGGAVGRAAAWWMVATLLGVAGEWPLTGAELTAWSDELEWVAWRPERTTSGWDLRLAVADPEAGRAWAVEAVDEGES